MTRPLTHSHFRFEERASVFLRNVGRAAHVLTALIVKNVIIFNVGRVIIKSSKMRLAVRVVRIGSEAHAKYMASQSCSGTIIKIRKKIILFFESNPRRLHLLHIFKICTKFTEGFKGTPFNSTLTCLSMFSVPRSLLALGNIKKVGSSEVRWVRWLVGLLRVRFASNRFTVMADPGRTLLYMRIGLLSFYCYSSYMALRPIFGPWPSCCRDLETVELLRGEDDIQVQFPVTWYCMASHPKERCSSF